MPHHMHMSTNSTKEVIREAAFSLFARDGYGITTVDDIVRFAGVARSTFFRLYGTKEAVIFPEHDDILERVEARLKSSDAASALDAVTDAVKVVLFHYVAEGERARERYRLTSAVPSLRERELLSSERYLRLFRRYISGWGDGTEQSELMAEVMAAGVVAAHNRVLRQWLRQEIGNPHVAIDAALALVADIYTREASGRAIVVVTSPGVSDQEILDSLSGLRPSTRT
jgi:AcrR family transcriptional regulator